MHPQITEIFNDAENRYLKPEELRFVTQYVSSLPERLDAYRNLRDRELEIMQWVADQLQAQMPQEKVETLERCIKNALLMLRYCAMGMLLNDEAFVKDRFLSWVSQTVKVYNTEAIDAALYHLLNQRLNQTLGSKSMSLLQPILSMVQNTLVPQDEPANGVAIGW
ncbi:MAG: hypothetical protein HC769_27975 [Cyanobacteria bacterium CRU_2_1]|nr:hypothetical protein [Cyanobacteria bacterium RU_5_0]NJR62321.1 hypothetical protein [Cyanobacteria bacterium CRU_2_1]